MDKISETVSSWWPSSAYEPIDDDGGPNTYEEMDEAEEVRHKPVEFSWWDYMIFALLGMAMLWSW